MYLHKYIVDSEVFYRISSDSAKPAGSVVLKTDHWKGRVPGTSNVESGLAMIEKTFKEEPTKDKEEKKTEELKKKPKKKAITELIRDIALAGQGTDGNV